MAKITMQTIADELEISRTTVWKVFNNYAGVSEDLKRRVIKKAKELGYKSETIDTFKPEVIEHPEVHTVSVIVSRPESAFFWTDIIHCLAKELHDSNVNLMYTYIPPTYEPGYTLPSSLKNGTTQGIIVLNVYDQQMLTMINQLSLPKVFLDTVPELPGQKLTGDLIMLEGFHSVNRLTSHLIEKGHTKIGFIGDIHYAQTNADRYKGYITAMAENGLAINQKSNFTDPIDIYSYNEAIGNFIAQLEDFPTAFVCASDHVAYFLYTHLTKKNYRIPEDIAITGYDGSLEYKEIYQIITTADVETDQLGRRLALQLLLRIKNPSIPYEIIYTSPTLKFRQSTND